MTEPADPAVESLARALLPALRESFAERHATARAFAELLLDATELALPLAQGDPAEAALPGLELLATRLDLYDWDGPPGWDEVLARGLAARPPRAALPSPLDGLGDAPDRAGQLALVLARARVEAGRLLTLGKECARGAKAEQLVAVHASLLRLVALAAAAGPLSLAADPQAGELPAPGERLLVREMDERAAAHSDFASAHEEWLARLQHDNPAAAVPAFRTFFAGLAQSLRVGLALRELRDSAGAGQAIAGDPEALLGAVGGWQPVRWAALRRGAPAVWWAELFPPAPALADPHAIAAREASQALDVLGRLWSARGVSLTGFTALASAFTARSAATLALWEELGPAAEAR